MYQLCTSTNVSIVYFNKCINCVFQQIYQLCISTNISIVFQHASVVKIYLAARDKKKITSRVENIKGEMKIAIIGYIIKVLTFFVYFF